MHQWGKVQDPAPRPSGCCADGCPRLSTLLPLQGGHPAVRRRHGAAGVGGEGDVPWQRGAGGCSRVHVGAGGCRRMQWGAAGCRGCSEVHVGAVGYRRMQNGAGGCSEVQRGACGCRRVQRGGVGCSPQPCSCPCPLRLSSREKTSCTASRWHPRSQHSPRVSRIRPAPGCRQPQGPYPCPRCLPHACPARPPVTQCRTEGSTRGLAAVPRLALDVMACEVLRVLQLTDTALVPISYLVPRKVRGGGGGGCGWHCVTGAWCHFMGATSTELGEQRVAGCRGTPVPSLGGVGKEGRLGADGG